MAIRSTQRSDNTPGAWITPSSFTDATSESESLRSGCSGRSNRTIHTTRWSYEGFRADLPPALECVGHHREDTRVGDLQLRSLRP